MSRFVIISLILILGGMVFAFLAFSYFCQSDACLIFNWQKINATNTFNDCVARGFPVSQSYPRECRAGNKVFKEQINLSSLKVVVDLPKLNDEISSPLEISGEARGFWFFEASFPIKLLDSYGNEISRTIAQAQSDWMTTDFVPFKAKLIFDNSGTATGTIVFKKDNPSGLPQNDEQFILPIRFQNAVNVDSGILGKILLSPICPVEHVPPLPQCAPKPYSADIDIYRKDNLDNPVKILKSNEDGLFKVLLDSGDYVVKIAKEGVLPRCEDKNVKIIQHKFVNLNISCDTGIR